MSVEHGVKPSSDFLRVPIEDIQSQDLKNLSPLASPLSFLPHDQHLNPITTFGLGKSMIRDVATVGGGGRQSPPLSFGHQSAATLALEANIALFIGLVKNLVHFGKKLPNMQDFH